MHYLQSLGVSSTAWCSEIGSLTSLDAPELHASIDVREPISLHQAVHGCFDVGGGGGGGGEVPHKNTNGCLSNKMIRKFHTESFVQILNTSVKGDLKASQLNIIIAFAW